MEEACGEGLEPASAGPGDDATNPDLGCLATQLDVLQAWTCGGLAVYLRALEAHRSLGFRKV